VDRRKFLKSSLIAGGSALLARKGLATAGSASQQPVAGAISPQQIAAARFPKDSGLWYGRVAAAGRLDV
jgi:hypothetical protein